MRSLYDIGSPEFEAAGITVVTRGATVELHLPDDSIVPAVLEEGKIALFPKRAAAHGRVVALLGVNPG